MNQTLRVPLRNHIGKHGDYAQTPHHDISQSEEWPTMTIVTGDGRVRRERVEGAKNLWV